MHIGNDFAAVDVLRQLGQWQRAADSAQSMLVAEPQSDGAWTMLAAVLPHLHRVAKAIQAAERAFALNPRSPSALHKLAAVRLRQNLLAEATRFAKQAIAFAPAGTLSFVALAGAHLARQNLAESDTSLRHAFSIEPLAEAHATRALLETRRGDHERAICHAEAAVAKKPFLVNVWQLLVQLYQKTRRTAGVIFALEQLVRYEPGDVLALADLGEYYRKAVRLHGAVAVLNRAVTWGPCIPIRLGQLWHHPAARRQRWRSASGVCKSSFHRSGPK